MKNKLIFFSMIVFIYSCAPLNKVHIDYNEYPVSKEIQTDYFKDDLYIIANSWMVESFVNAPTVIQFIDKDKGIIIGKYLISGDYDIGESKSFLREVDTRIYGIITILCKDQLTKINIAPQGEGDYYPPDPDPAMYSRPNFYPSPEEIQEMINNLIASFEQYIHNYNFW